jgi:hypothetical protein
MERTYATPVTMKSSWKKVKNMTDALTDSLEVLSNILSIVHDTALSDSMKVDIIQNEIEHFLNRHEEGKVER